MTQLQTRRIVFIIHLYVMTLEILDLGREKNAKCKMLVCANCNNVIPSGCQDVAIQLLWVLAGGCQGVASRIHVVYRVLLLYSVAVVSLVLHSLNSIYKGVAIQLHDTENRV